MMPNMRNVKHKPMLLVDFAALQYNSLKEKGSASGQKTQPKLDLQRWRICYRFVVDSWKVLGALGTMFQTCCLESRPKTGSNTAQNTACVFSFFNIIIRVFGVWIISKLQINDSSSIAILFEWFLERQKMWQILDPRTPYLVACSLIVNVIFG